MAERSRYLDTLRVIAVLRVYLLHALWWSWLPTLFPSIWVMFAIAGTLTAASLERGDPVRTVGSRVRRLLPPLWTLAALAVPLMTLRGWPHRWWDVLWWIVPLANPPGSAWAGGFTLHLWYLRAYLFLVLVSPALWWAFRRWPRATLLAAPGAAVLMYAVGLPASPVTDNLWSTATYGTCWLIGYARHTRLLDRLRPWTVTALAAALAAASMAWSATGHGPGDALTDLLWGTGYTLVLMRLRPELSWLDRLPALAWALRAVNARAVTVYVWHLPVFFGVTLALAWAGPLTVLTAGTVALCGVVLAVGWVEDLAARRPPALIPYQRPPARLRR
ncbi:acyltransferase [Actinomycetes bacterium KLBMP 9797]